MLLKFKVGNFRSFEEVMEFSMIPGTTRSHHNHICTEIDAPILKNTVIYGANAAGKTSFVKAIEVSRLMILSDFNNLPGLRKMYCRKNINNKSKPTYFEYVIEENNEFYSYGFETILSEGKYTAEWLIKLDPTDPDNEKIIFERDLSDISNNKELSFGKIFSKKDLDRLDVYGSDISGNYNTLFLNEMSRKNFETNQNLNVFKKIYNWFLRKLMVNTINLPDKNTIRGAGKIMESLGTDISNLAFKNASRDDLSDYDPFYLSNVELTLRNNCINGGPTFIMDLTHWICFELVDGSVKASKVYTKHSSSDSEYDIDEESTGTIQTLSLISLLTNSNDDITYLMDEFGNAMHPLLATEFVKLFQKHNANMKNQLIISTHLLSLMTLDLFRRDEIWFVDKENGVSMMYSLEDFKERFDKKLDKAYIEGRYGALPLIKDLEVP